MDIGFADFDFQSFNEEIKTKPVKVARGAPVRKPRKPVTEVSDKFNVCGPAEKTRKRLLELQQILAIATAADGDGTEVESAAAIVELELIPQTEEELDAAIESMRELAVELVSGRASVPIGDNHKHHKCSLKLACERCWEGDHGASHTTANWLICHLLKFIFRVVPKVDSTADDRADAGEHELNAWDVEEDEEHGSYRYIPHEKQTYLIEARPRRNTNLQKTRNLFQNTIRRFFSGHTSMPRIGALSVKQILGSLPAYVVRSKHDPANDWCKKPYCTQTLLAPSVERGSVPACAKFHSDESSFLTSMLRVLVECRRVARPRPDASSEGEDSSATAAHVKTPRVGEDGYEAPRTSRKAPRQNGPTAAKPAEAQPRNTFATLLDEADDSDEPDAGSPAERKVDVATSIRITELETKLAAFEKKNSDAIKYNRSLRERRDKMVAQITALRSESRDSFH
jgi:hypothetical protein